MLHTVTIQTYVSVRTFEFDWNPHVSLLRELPYSDFGSVVGEEGGCDWHFLLVNDQLHCMLAHSRRGELTREGASAI